MNHAKTLAGLIFAGLFLAACSSTPVATQEDFSKALSSAKLSLSKAKKARFEWRDSGKILKQAEDAAKSGDYSKAVALANKAQRQGELAVIQAETQKNAGKKI